MALLSQRNGSGYARQSGHKQLVICPRLKSVTFTKMAKMPDCCMCSQQFTIKRGVIGLRVGQFSGKETKWSPMVPRFLLQDVADMSIRGVSGKRKFSLRGGMLEGYRRCQEALCILESLPCRGGPFEHLGPPFQEISQRCNTCTQLG